MLIGATAGDGAADTRIVSLLALAEAERVVSERDESLRSQTGRDAMVFGLARLRMTRREEHGRMRAGGSGQIQIGSDVIVREAFEDDLLERVSWIDQPASDARIERTPVVGQSADQVENLAAHLPLARLGLRLGADRVDRGLALVELPLRSRIHPRQQRTWPLLLGGQGRREEHEDAHGLL